MKTYEQGIQEERARTVAFLRNRAVRGSHGRTWTPKKSVLARLATLIERGVHWTLAALVLTLLLPVNAHAEDRDSLPFELKCPDVLHCKRNEKGQWVPNWYVRDTAAELETLRARASELQSADAQQESLRRALRASEEHVETLERELLVVERGRAAREAALAQERTKKVRRTRWAIGATVLSVVLGTALGAGIYVAAH